MSRRPGAAASQAVRSSIYWAEEHALLRTSLRSYFEANTSPVQVWEWDRQESFPEHIWRGLAELGILGLCFPEEYGGSPGDEFAMCTVVEEIARVGAFLLYAYLPTVSYCAKTVARFGTEDQKRAILPEVAAGRLRMSMGLSEPDAGSDLAHLSTRAESAGDGFRIHGQKVFTTGADTAAQILTLVRTDPDRPIREALSLLLVPAGSPGLTIRPLTKMAGQATHTCEVFFDGVEVPGEALIGGPAGRGRGLAMALEMLDGERIYVGAQGVGMAQAALDIATAHARHRVQFGKPIIEHQAVAHMLADIDIETEAARQLVLHAAWRLENGHPCSREAAIAKTFGSEAASRSISRAMQVLGGYSYIVDYGIERLYRECKLNEIAGGTNQILRNVLARQLAQALT